MEAENRVLLVEDEAPLRRSLEKFLEWSGYPYDSCSSARDALVLARSSKYDIIILEYHLPDANAETLLRDLKLVSPDMASIVLSEFDYPAVSRKLLTVDVRSFLKKPFDVAELESAMISASSKQSAPGGKSEWEQRLVLDHSPASILLRELSEYKYC
ncbi:MAG: response regulator [Syntrophobacteraceae bacterium]|nr:response regulator [Syntrophobacteraceae bacterium]